MTPQEAIEMLTAKAECIRREASGIDVDCIYCNCDECDLCYKQGTMGEQREALKAAIEALQNSAELISWLDECISDEHTTPIERATLMAVKCKAEEIAYGRNDN